MSDASRDSLSEPLSKASVGIFTFLSVLSEKKNSFGGGKMRANNVAELDSKLTTRANWMVTLTIWNSHVFVCRRSVSQGCGGGFRTASHFNELQNANCGVSLRFLQKISGKNFWPVSAATSRATTMAKDSDFYKRTFRSLSWTANQLVGEIKKRFQNERHRVLSITFLARLWPDSCLANGERELRGAEAGFQLPQSGES